VRSAAGTALPGHGVEVLINPLQRDPEHRLRMTQRASSCCSAPAGTKFPHPPSALGRACERRLVRRDVDPDDGRKWFAG